MSELITPETPISKIDSVLDGIFGASSWHDWEPETILIELGLSFDHLLLDKLNVLRIFHKDPLLVFHDPIYFLYASEVVNNHGADFDSVPHVTMLEAAWSIQEFTKLTKKEKVTLHKEDLYPIAKTCAYILVEDGASEPIPPFNFVDKEDLTPGQTEQDTENKKQAITSYITHMEELK